MKVVRLKSETVGELIRALARFDASARIAWQDHDASEGEISAKLTAVADFEPDGSQESKWTRGISVILR